MRAVIFIVAVLGLLFALWQVVLMLQRPQTHITQQPSQMPRASGAAGGLRLCNKTSSRVSVAFGYKGEKGWVTEGWWNATPGMCEMLQEGPLRAKFYYIYAVDGTRGGEWGGRHMMCTQDKKFTIYGVKDCEKRGFTKNGFFEIDTGEFSTWVVQIDETGRTGKL